ncbi:MAG: hypothetical protein IPL95_18560 [Saprospiraceae bacterium]|nr:hypothetical protein [Saprospiraceae bacterium]
MENEEDADPLKRGETKIRLPANVEPPKVQEVKNANPLKEVEEENRTSYR